MRRDLEEIVAQAAKVGLYSNLITAGVLLTRERLEALAAARPRPRADLHPGRGCRPTPIASRTTRAATPRSWRWPAGCARSACRSPSTRRSIARTSTACRPIIELAVSLGAQRLEVAHVQYYGWALKNRQALMPTREQVLRSAELVEAARERLKGILVIDFVVPDYYAARPKPCMGGWGRGIINVTPSGKVLPCHAAETIPGLAFDNVRDTPPARHLARLRRLPALPRHGLDARAVPLLRVARDRLGRLPLPGASPSPATRPQPIPACAKSAAARGLHAGRRAGSAAASRHRSSSATRAPRARQPGDRPASSRKGTLQRSFNALRLVSPHARTRQPPVLVGICRNAALAWRLRKPGACCVRRRLRPRVRLGVVACARCGRRAPLLRLRHAPCRLARLWPDRRPCGRSAVAGIGIGVSRIWSRRSYG